MFTEIGADKKPFAFIRPAVCDDPPVPVIIFPRLSHQNLPASPSDAQEFLIEAIDRFFIFQILLHIDLRVQRIHALPRRMALIKSAIGRIIPGDRDPGMIPCPVPDKAEGKSFRHAEACHQIINKMADRIHHFSDIFKIAVR